eukprot:2441313-Lingulodinium_polyedra.AAC.1
MGLRRFAREGSSAHQRLHTWTSPSGDQAQIDYVLNSECCNFEIRGYFEEHIRARVDGAPVALSVRFPL